MDNIFAQECIEKQYNRKHIDTKIRKEIMENMQEKVQEGVVLINQYMDGQYYDSKMNRIAQLRSLEVDTLVLDILVGIAYSQRPELFTSVSAKIASRLQFSDRVEAITTVAEMLAILCQTDAFDIFKEDKFASLQLVSRIPLSKDLVHFVVNSEYLPPMICEPLELEHNYSSGYLTHNDSLILGTGNHHDGDICLDVLNNMSKVALKLDTEFLSKVEEDPTFSPSTQEELDQWMKFKRQSYEFYHLIVTHGNKFWLNHKVDKRGRIYSCGYHIHTQGNSFKKAMIELANEEIVTM